MKRKLLWHSRDRSILSSLSLSLVLSLSLSLDCERSSDATDTDERHLERIVLFAVAVGANDRDARTRRGTRTGEVILLKNTSYVAGRRGREKEITAT